MLQRGSLTTEVIPIHAVCTETSSAHQFSFSRLQTLDWHLSSPIQVAVIILGLSEVWCIFLSQMILSRLHHAPFGSWLSFVTSLSNKWQVLCN